MSGLLYNIEAIQNYYDNGLTAMATFKVSKTQSAVSTLNGNSIVGLPSATIMNVAYHSGQNTANLPLYVATGGMKIPAEFLNKLPSSGAIPAPAGACPAAAQPQVTFMTEGGNAVTPALIEQKALKEIPSELVTMAQDDPNSLYSKIESMVPQGDMRLATAQGWDDLLWTPLKAMQEPAESLMDYQLWNASQDIMEPDYRHVPGAA